MRETASKPFNGTWVLGSGITDGHMRGSSTEVCLHGQPGPTGHSIHTMVEATQHYIRFSRGMPSPVPLYFATKDTRVVFHEHKATCEFLARCDGITGRVVTVRAGTTVTIFMGSDGKLKSEGGSCDTAYNTEGGSCDTAYNTPAIREDLTLDAAVREIKTALCEEVRLWGSGETVGIMLSGGVDSLSVLWALKEVGQSVEALSFGTKDDAYDPHFAKLACEYLGIPFRRVGPPDREDDLKTFMRRAVHLSEQTQGPNVRMAASLWTCASFFQRAGISKSWQGFVADRLLGNKGQCVGQFRALPLDEQTSEAWRDKRIEFSAIQSPNTDMISKAIRVGVQGHDWRSPFHTPRLWDLLLSLPLASAPAAQNKLALKSMMAGILPEDIRGWEQHQKMPFNIGSGFADFGKVNHWASDAGIKELHREIKSSAKELI